MSLDIRRRLIGTAITNADPPRTDVGLILLRILLFDTYILQSARLRELPMLIRTLGYEGTSALLRSGVLRLYCDAMTTGQVGQAANLRSRPSATPLPLGSYCFQTIAAISHQDHISLCFRDLESTLPLRKPMRRRIKQDIIDALEPRLETIGPETIAWLRTRLLTNDRLVNASVAVAARSMLQIEPPPRSLSVRFFPLNDQEQRVETNLREVFQIDELEAHKIVERAALTVAGLSQRIGEMKALTALSGFSEGEVGLFEEELSFITQAVDPEAQERRARRVLNILDLPDLSQVESGERIDVEQLLIVRDSAECREFREWLRGIDGNTDDEIRDRVRSFGAKVSAVLKSRVGRKLRTITSVGIGTRYPLAGLAIGAIDSFILDELLSEPGITTFLDEMYPSLFQGTGHRDES